MAETRIVDALRGAVAGGQAAKLVSAATAIFEAGGKKLLSESSKSAVRSLAEKGAERALAVATAPLLPVGITPGKLLTSGARATAAVAKGTARAAAREIAKGAGKAAGIGFVVDGAVATVEGVVAVRAGRMDKNEAVSHVVKEAATGAVDRLTLTHCMMKRSGTIVARIDQDRGLEHADVHGRTGLRVERSRG